MRTNQRSYTRIHRVLKGTPLYDKYLDAFVVNKVVTWEGVDYIVVDHSRIKGTDSTEFYMRKS